MKKVFLGMVVVFILIQMIRPNKNDSRNSINDITTELEVPEEIKTILKTSCSDCHSNYTKYPWYSEIAPISWWMGGHIKKGKKHFNYSEWTAYNADQKKHIIKDLKEVLEAKKMPLKSYLLMHKEAKLTSEQYQLLLNWVNSLEIE